MNGWLADRLDVPRCARCDRPIWTPVAILCVWWLGRRYHFFCYRRQAAERAAG